MVYVGKHWYVLIGKETAWGTAASATKDVGLVQSMTINDSNNLRRLFSASQRNATDLISGGYDVGGTIDVIYQNARLLGYAIGRPVDNTTPADHDATGTPDIKHIMAETDTLTSFTLEDGYNSTADTVLKYSGCVINDITLKLALDNQLHITANFIGKSVATTTASATTAVVSTLTPLPDYFGSLTTGADGAEVAIGDLQSFEFTISNELEKLRKCGTRLLSDLQATERQYTFKFTMGFSTPTEYNLFLGGAGVLAGTPGTATTPLVPSFVFTVTNGLAANSGLRSVVIDCNNCAYNTVGKPSVIKGYIFQDFEGYAKSLNSIYAYDNITGANW
jgi:hypothetical protein